MSVGEGEQRQVEWVELFKADKIFLLQAHSVQFVTS